MLPKFGEIKLENGNPICHICGKSYKRLMTHTRQAHNISSKDYKLKFGLNVTKSLISDHSKALSRKRIFENPKVLENIKDSIDTRFKKGSKGRTKEKLSQQELNRIKSMNKKSKKQIENCKKLGESWLGNIARWGNTRI